MGKVASDKCHKWVFKEPSESEPNLANYWQSSFDAVCFLSLPQIFKYLLFWLDEKLMVKMVNTFWLFKNLLQLPPEWTDQFESGIQVNSQTSFLHVFFLFFFQTLIYCS